MLSNLHICMSPLFFTVLQVFVLPLILKLQVLGNKEYGFSSFHILVQYSDNDPVCSRYSINVSTGFMGHSIAWVMKRD